MQDFAMQHPGWTFLIIWVLGWVVTSPFRFAFRAWNRTLRSRNIAAQGWPKAPIDADGDVVYDKDE